MSTFQYDNIDILGFFGVLKKSLHKVIAVIGSFYMFRFASARLVGNKLCTLNFIAKLFLSVRH